ncbi:hypothetical protein C8Q76DRAFT_117323 [Earliella scabrosa]|nr:hypothetical protein C8Q76DRAFT_117323 [Earliella scabrosa]
MVYAGMTVVLARAFDFEQFLKSIQQYRISHLFSPSSVTPMLSFNIVAQPTQRGRRRRNQNLRPTKEQELPQRGPWQRPDEGMSHQGDVSSACRGCSCLETTDRQSVHAKNDRSESVRHGVTTLTLPPYHHQSACGG